MATAPRRVEVDGTTYNRLTVGAFVDLCEQIWLDMRRQLIRDMDDARVDGQARVEALERHLHRRGMPELVGYAAMRASGAKMILDRCGVPMDTINAMPVADAIAAARELASMDGDGEGKATATAQ